MTLSYCLAKFKGCAALSLLAMCLQLTFVQIVFTNAIYYCIHLRVALFRLAIDTISWYKLLMHLTIVWKRDGIYQSPISPTFDFYPRGTEFKHLYCLCKVTRIFPCLLDAQHLEQLQQEYHALLIYQNLHQAMIFSQNKIFWKFKSI